MPDHKKRAEGMLFNYETTSRTDYRDGEIKPIVTTVYKGKPKSPRPPFKPIKDVHAMSEWRVNNLPFDLFHKPKDIIRTHPRDVQSVYNKPQDIDKEVIQKTRPRLVMTPAVSMDDFDPERRKDLVKDFYTTTTQRGFSGVSETATVASPYADHPAPAQPITIEKLQVPYVSPQWRLQSVRWHGRQLRTFAHPTKQFWLTKKPKPQRCGTFHFV